MCRDALTSGLARRQDLDCRAGGPGGQEATRSLEVRDIAGKTTIELDGFGKITLGGNGSSGGITLNAPNGTTTASR